MKTIGILVTGHLPDAMQEKYIAHSKLFEALLNHENFQFKNYHVIDDQFPDSIHQADGWVITGSKHGAYEDFPWIKKLEDFIVKLYNENMPLVGICFGHQIIAQALGGVVEKFKGGWSVGVKEYSIDAIGDKLAIGAWHQDQIVVKPNEAKVICSTDFCQYAGLLYDKNILTLQPHPEFSNQFVQDLYESRKETLSKKDQNQVLESIDTKITNDPIARHMIQFFNGLIMKS